MEEILIPAEVYEPKLPQGAGREPGGVGIIVREFWQYDQK